MNILIIGNSHTNVLKFGYDSFKDRIPNDFNIKISGVGNPELDKWRLVNSVIHPVEGLLSDGKPYPIKDYDLIIISAGYSVSDPRLLYQEGIYPLSESILLDIVKSSEDPNFQHSKHSPVIKSLLNDDECMNNILLLGSPYPSNALHFDSLNKVPLKKILRPLQGIYSSLGSGLTDCDIETHKKNHARILTTCSTLFDTNPRIKYYFPPRCLLDDSTLFTKKEFMNCDGLHGNMKYGKIIFDDLLMNFLGC